MSTFTTSFFHFVFALIVLSIVGCSTPRHQALRKIEVGMDKAEVLDRLGNPNRITRQHSQDRWTYEVSNNSTTESTYIYFAEGRVTYVGSAPEFGAPGAKLKSSKGALKSVQDDFKPVGDAH